MYWQANRNYPQKPSKFLWLVISSSWAAAACLMHLPLLREHRDRDYNRGITIYHEAVIPQAQVIQSLVTFQHSSGRTFSMESPKSEDRKRWNEAHEKI